MDTLKRYVKDQTIVAQVTLQIIIFVPTVKKCSYFGQDLVELVLTSNPQVISTVGNYSSVKLLIDYNDEEPPKEVNNLMLIDNNLFLPPKPAPWAIGVIVEYKEYILLNTSVHDLIISATNGLKQTVR